MTSMCEPSPNSTMSKKRLTREKTDTLKYGNENLLRDILPFVDSINRALAQADTGKGDIESFRRLKMIEEQLSSCLKKHGVEQIECASKVF